ncbi:MULTISPECIES: DUF3104 domain-containing protein [unclassified Synechococcus]
MVVLRQDNLSAERVDKHWLIGQVIHCGGAVCGPKPPLLLQIADVDSVVICWVSDGLVTHTLSSI